MNIEYFIYEKIHWKFDASKSGYIGQWGNEIFFLRLNDFPDEPMYTLIYGSDRLDIEEKPNKWTFD